MASKYIPVAIAFLLGCFTSATILLNFALPAHESNNGLDAALAESSARLKAAQGPDVEIVDASSSPLKGIRILIAIAAYDFSQLPHLEEVIDTYQDLCVTGASVVDIVIHATIPYPVTLIDLLNTRLVPSCEKLLSISIVVKSPSMKLHLVDCHRTLFYEKIDEYDLFIYTEDDIRVSPRTVGTYLWETAHIQEIVGKQRSSDFNVGIVRYEYNYPSNIVMDDNTRHATQNVTRVYWEHGQYPVFPKGVEAVPVKELENSHVHMHNHHQGMFLATRDLLKAWKDRPGCEFDRVRNRPGLKNRPSQPSEGTQRVWMSSQMLYGGHHCGVQQVIPVANFGALSVLHLPNKNYRRVGRFRNRTFSDGTEKFDFGVSGTLLTAMRLHLETKKAIPQKPNFPYHGIRMMDDCSCPRRCQCSPLLKRRMDEYQAYVDRGGLLSEEDMTKTDLVEAS